jgi:hypothetical protein
MLTVQGEAETKIFAEKVSGYKGPQKTAAH